MSRGRSARVLSSKGGWLRVGSGKKGYIKQAVLARVVKNGKSPPTDAHSCAKRRIDGRG
ncbi:MAG: hypothetical protein R3C68_05440 [Myxococcota bacterium]